MHRFFLPDVEKNRQPHIFKSHDLRDPIKWLLITQSHTCNSHRISYTFIHKYTQNISELNNGFMESTTSGRRKR